MNISVASLAALYLASVGLALAYMLAALFSFNEREERSLFYDNTIVPLQSIWQALIMCSTWIVSAALAALPVWICHTLFHVIGITRAYTISVLTVFSFYAIMASIVHWSPNSRSVLTRRQAIVGQVILTGATSIFAGGFMLIAELLWETARGQEWVLIGGGSWMATIGVSLLVSLLGMKRGGFARTKHKFAFGGLDLLRVSKTIGLNCAAICGAAACSSYSLGNTGANQQWWISLVVLLGGALIAFIVVQFSLHGFLEGESNLLAKTVSSALSSINQMRQPPNVLLVVSSGVVAVVFLVLDYLVLQALDGNTSWLRTAVVMLTALWCLTALVVQVRRAYVFEQLHRNEWLRIRSDRAIFCCLFALFAFVVGTASGIHLIQIICILSLVGALVWETKILHDAQAGKGFKSDPTPRT